MGTMGYDQQEGSMHPTGMHRYLFYSKFLFGLEFADHIKFSFTLEIVALRLELVWYL